MEEPFGDARLEELKFLAEIDRHGTLAVDSPKDDARRDMIAGLVSAERVTDPAMRWTHFEDHWRGWSGLKGESVLERQLNGTQLNLFSRVLGGASVELRITHWGRLRMSELKQALRSGRERDPLGILWDARHWEQDLQIAILDASARSPLSVVLLDMNGLKQVNDQYGHDSGDRALKTYFSAVASAVGERGQAYRLGGDEVLIVLPNHDIDRAVVIVTAACRLLMKEQLKVNGPCVPLSIAAGIHALTDPTVSHTIVRDAADQTQYRAKARSKESTLRPSVIAIDGKDDLIVLEHEAATG